MIAVLLLCSLLAPLGLLAACFANNLRGRALGLQWLACVPALLAGLFGSFSAPVSVAVGPARLLLDRPGALLLFGAALIWGLICWAIWRDDKIPDARFGVSFLLTLIGCFWVFVADDLVSFYLAYALVSLPAYGLFAFSAEPEKKRAGAVYLGFALLGEAILLAAFAGLAAIAPDASHGLAAQVAQLAAPGRSVILALIVAGFGMKIGLLPFNGWMPLNYVAAPIPVAALLSGAGVKAGVIGLIRFLPLGAALPEPGVWLGALGFLTAFYGVALGLTQNDPKAILAYSSISQMGVIAAALGLGLAAGDASAGPALAFYGFNHLLVKAALFLTIGAAAAGALPLSGAPLVLASALALDLAGLPLTGGALAKLAAKDFFDSGVWAALSIFSSIGSGLLMSHFIGQLAEAPREAAGETPPALARNWPGVAAGALVLPWLFAPKILEALEPAKIWEGLWPVGFGVILGVAWRRVGAPAPAVPVGDTVVVYERVFGWLVGLGPALERFDRRLRLWPVAGASVLAILLALVFAAG